MTDLLALTHDLVKIPSVSHHESAIADHIQTLLEKHSHLEVLREENTVVARTNLGRAQRLALGGHIDTVPPNGNEHALLDGDVLWGIGSADMKAGCAVMLALADTVAEPVHDLTFVFYECEEVARSDNGLHKLWINKPESVQADAAILLEPTGAKLEAGCQGTLRVDIALTGERAHTARPWQGTNAVHRLIPLLQAVDSYEGRRPVIQGCTYREVLQAVKVHGGIAGNVVPDLVNVQLNHRFAPDHTPEEAFEIIAKLLAPHLNEADVIHLGDGAAGAMPSLDHPLINAIVEQLDEPPEAKLGWTDVASFTAHGVPAANFGPGDPAVAHRADEHVDREQLEKVFATLKALIS